MNRTQSYTINSTFVLALAALALFAPPAARAQATITVDSTAQEVTLANPTGIVNGNCTLGEAILAANTNAAVDGCTAGSVAGPDTIIVPAGTYTLALVDFIEVSGPSSPLEDLPFGLPRIVSNIIITGVTAANTIIERSTAPGTPTFAFLEIHPVGTLTVNNLTFRNGNQSSSAIFAISNAGGAIFNANGGAAALAINNCVFDSNTTTGIGGAIANGATINNSTFANNTAGLRDGGAIAVPTSSFLPVPPDLIITNSTFSSNSAGGSGGAISAGTVALGNGPVTISHSVFTNNNSAGSGGALEVGVGCGGCSLFASIDASLFSGNQSGDGGAIHFTKGGAAANGSVTISNSAFVNNPFLGAGTDGGAINANGGSLTISNSTFSGNSSGNRSGGAIATNSQTSLNNVTIVNNSGANGGVVVGGTFSYSNTIIAGNSPSDTFQQGTVTSLGFNLIGDNTSSGAGFPTVASDQEGTGANPINPLVGGLANNGSTVMAGSNVGGQTPQVVPTHALLIGSPALGAGDTGVPGSGAPACEATDQRGIARPQPAGGTCDVGALEDLTGSGIAASADMSITITDSPDPVNNGATITYTITVTNNGPDPTANVVVTDVLPAGVTFSTASAGCSNAAGTVTCNLGTMSSGAVQIITIDVTATGSGQVNNSPSVTATSGDPDNTNNSQTTSTMIAAQDADLTILKTDSPDPVDVNANLTYTITVTNTGPANATNLSMMDVLPVGVTFQSISAPAGWTCTTPAVGANGTVTCTNPALAANAQAAFTLVVRPGTGAAFNTSNTATVSATENDPVAADNSSTASTQVNPLADLSVTKTDTPDPAAVGSNITYTITVTNNGPSPATGVSVTDNVPANVTFVSGTGSGAVTCTQVGGIITCNVGTLASGASASATVVVRTTALGTVTNTVSVASAVTDPTPGNDSATATTAVTVPPATDFSLTLVPVIREVRAGGTATYTATLTPLPAGSSFNTAIALTCFTSLTVATCAASPASATPGINPATSTISVTIPTSGVAPGAPRSPQPPVFQPWLLPLFGAMLATYLLLSLRFQRLWMQRGVALALLLFALALAVGQSACTKASDRPIAPYVLTVTATSGSLSHSATATVNLVK